MKAFFVIALSLLFAGCATLPGDVLRKSYKVGTPRANLLPLAEQHNLIRFASRSRPAKGWSSEVRNKRDSAQRLEAAASTFEQENPGKLVHLGELYLVNPKNYLSIPDLSGDTLLEYHYWFFDAQTNLLGYDRHHDYDLLDWPK